MAITDRKDVLSKNENQSNALKAISESPDELRVGNHMILFGGRDLTGYAGPNYEGRKNKDGSRGEYFSPSTELESEFTKNNNIAVDFEHRGDPDGIGIKDAILGRVDWKTMRKDERGIFVERVLDRRNKYVKWLEPLIKDGLIGNSSECDISGRVVSDNGEIKSWPIKRDTLTVMPMESRMLTANAIAALKSLSNELPYFKSFIPEPTALTNSGDEQKTLQGVNKMENEELQKTVSDAVAAALKERETAEAEKATRIKEIEDAKTEAAKAAVEELKKKGMLKNVPYIKSENMGGDNDGVMAFKSWVATGQVNSSLLEADESWTNKKAAFNVSAGESGAYLVPDPLFQTIQAKRDIASWVRRAPCQYFTTPADHILVPVEDTKMTTFTKTAEGGAYNENEGTVAQKDIILYKFTKLVKMSEEFVNYQNTNFDAWLTNALARAVARTENTIFTTGTGTNEPEGIRNNVSTGNTVTTSATLVPGDLTSLIGKLGAGYNVEGECGFLMQNATKWYLKGLQTTGYFAYINTPAGQDQGFHGYPAFISDDMDAYTVAASTGHSLIFGNYTYFGVAEKPGMMLQRNPYLYMGTGQIGLFASIFRGSAVLQSEAFYWTVGK